MDVLTGLFADDELTVEELEERLDRCYRAGSVDELESLFTDLPARPDFDAPRPERGGGARSVGTREAGGGAAAGARRRRGGGGGRTTGTPAGGEGAACPAEGEAGRPPAGRTGHDLVLGVMSGVARSGRWTPPRHMNAVAVMGGVELDFRRARFPPGPTTVNAVAFWGAVEITVPPDLRVECAGVPLLGGFDQVDQDGDEEAHPGAVLRIRGLACMGAVEVKVEAPEG